MDSAGSNYPAAVPRWCLATARPSIIEQPRRHFRGCANWHKRLTRVNSRCFNICINSIDQYIQLHFSDPKLPMA